MRNSLNLVKFQGYNPTNTQSKRRGMPPHLALHLLGSPQIQLNEVTITLGRRKALALLAYLAIERGGHRRESLSALLWPDYSQTSAYKNLRQTLWEIQQTLGEGWLIADREKIAWNDGSDSSTPLPGQAWLDVREFEAQIAQGRAHSEPDVPLRISLLADSARLYRNHFLTGFSLKDASPFNEWAFAESEELRRKLADTLVTLSTDYVSAGKADKAIPYARRLVALDPLNESTHRQLMEVYIQAGQHSAALKQYQTLEQTLRKELNLDPQPETRALYKQIRKGDLKPVPVVRPVESLGPNHNLPAQLSTFIGREKEKAEVMSLLQKNRLVTLAGIGGIGKTRLALQVGEKLLKEYPNGVWFIALDSLSDPALVPQTVAAVFGIRESSRCTITESLTAALKSHTVLLIFDNCEHLLDACAPLITTLLGNCPNLKILATSRETLNQVGESVYHLSPLSVPEHTHTSIDRLSENESVRLFTERATLSLAAFRLVEENAQTVVAIGRKVGGIPLAIELAAARVNIMHVDEILKQLNHSFTLLSSDQRTVTPRHLTLQASMDWSWGLLDDTERIFLQQLSAFAGGWTMESAQAVCEGEVLGLTGALVKKSLLVVDQQPGRWTRYRFHEIVREYIHTRQVESDGHAQIHDRHLKYFLALAQQAEVELRGPASADWMERLNDEINNFRTALLWADRTNVEAGLYLSSRLVQYWESANLREGDQWLQKFIHKPESKGFPQARARALHTFSWLLTWQQKFDQAYAVAKECLALFRSVEDRAGEVDALLSVANIIQFKDELSRSVEIGRQALTLARSLGDQRREANAFNYIGWGSNDLKRKFDYWETAILLYRSVGDQIALANLLGLMGQFKVLNGELEQGEKYQEEAMRLWQSNKRGNVWENPKVTKSLILMMKGEYEEAQTLLEEVRASAQETGNRMSYLWAHVRLGCLLSRSGNLAEARQLLNESAEQFNQAANSVGTIFALEATAGLFVTLGKPERAARLLGWADAMREKVRDLRPPIEQADVDQIIAACLARLGEAAFSDAYDEGREFSPAEAVAYALKE